MRLASGADYSIDDVHIRSEHEDWFPVEVHQSPRLIFVRTGMFRLRVGNWEVLAHPILAYVVGPGDEQRIAHRRHASDACTGVSLSVRLLSEIVGDRLPSAPRPMYTTGRIDLQHRVLVSRARAGADDFELAERVTRLAADMLAPRRGPGGAVGADPQGRAAASAGRLAEAAREMIMHDPVSLGLGEIARQLGISSPYLSRVFQQHVGVSLTRFRNQVRVRRALERIEAGEESLAQLAFELGFADHAHMTRTIRSEVGHPPASVRRMLAPAGVG
jgi:AraC-like DNA-binding protein